MPWASRALDPWNSSGEADSDEILSQRDVRGGPGWGSATEEELSNLRSGGGRFGVGRAGGHRERTGSRSAVIRLKTGLEHLPEEMMHSWWSCRKSDSGSRAS